MVTILSLAAPESFEEPQQQLHQSVGSNRRSLGELMAASGTDKYWRHAYQRYYERELAPYRSQAGVRLLEIGAWLGLSLQVWLEYFDDPGAIQSIDLIQRDDLVDSAQEMACKRTPHRCHMLRMHIANQANVHDLDRVIAAEPLGWDIIIDDGSHWPTHQLLSFRRLFPHLRPGGLYVIEDLESSYMDAPLEGWAPGGLTQPPGGLGRRNAAPSNAVEAFKDVVDVVMRRRFAHLNYTVFGQEVDADIVRISFGDGILFAEKRPHARAWSPHVPRPWKEGKWRFEQSVREHEAFRKLRYF